LRRSEVPHERAFTWVRGDLKVQLVRTFRAARPKPRMYDRLRRLACGSDLETLVEDPTASVTPHYTRTRLISAALSSCLADNEGATPIRG
jgi:hypothetical protein